MGESQKRALQTYRKRLGDRGMARFEVLGLDADRELIRALARRLAEKGPQARLLRTAVGQLSAEPAKKGGVLAALRRSPLADGEITIRRERSHGRRVDL